MTGMPDSVRDAIAAMGPNFNPDVQMGTRDLYAPLVQKSREIETFCDVPYGSNERQKLDIYTPTRDGRRAVILYIPGGGFNGGDKRGDEIFYGNLGRWFARHNVITVIANYRLAPTFGWPAGAEDVTSAMAWVWTNIEQYGGDRERIFLFGQSAGATHASTSMFHPKVRDERNQPVAAILASGVYDIRAGNLPPNVKAYFGIDASKYEDRSPIMHVANSKVPLFLSVAEYDPPGLCAPTLDLAAAVTRRDGKAPRILWQKNHNHVSTVLSFNTGDDAFGEAVLDFMRGALAKR